MFLYKTIVDIVKKSTSKKFGITASILINLRNLEDITLALVLKSLLVSSALFATLFLAKIFKLETLFLYQLLRKFEYITNQAEVFICMKSPEKTSEFWALRVIPFKYTHLFFVKLLIVLGSGNNLESKIILSIVIRLTL